VEQVRAVAVVLNPGLAIGFRERVAAEVLAAFEHHDWRVHDGSDALRHHGAEKAAANDDVAVITQANHSVAPLEATGVL
jgi:hypothetical protein